jgi:flagellar biosynthesis anti-sigma factor FlgM
MKIRSDNQQPAVAQQVIEKSAAPQESEAARQKAPAKAAPKKDSVEFSAALDAELQSRQAGQAERVEAIKAQLSAGEYEVSSRAVAEKMLSGRPKS